MNIWLKVELLQALVFISATLAGALVFRLPWVHAMIAALFTLPAPLFQVTSGAAGFVYGADLVGGVLAVPMILHTMIQPWLGRRFLFLFWSALFLLLVWPFATTMFNLLGDDSKEIKFIALGIFRGTCYLTVFLSAIDYGSRHDKSPELLAVSCLSFFGVCLLGLAQQSLGVDLDLWNRVRDIDPTAHTDGYGGGFMGLYRGAVGAWSAGVLSILPIVYLHRKFGWLITGVMASVILGATAQTGSRQGIIYGLGGFLFGLFVSVFLVKSGRRTTIWNSISKTAAVMLLIGGTVAATLQNSELQEWLLFRFQSSLGEDSFLRAAINREAKAEAILRHLWEEPVTLLLGTGQGAIQEDVTGPGQRFSLVYVDSELLWTLQQGGLVQFLTYLGFIAMLFRRTYRFYSVSDPRPQIAQAAALAALVVGTALSYGHFFLLHVQSTQAPIAFWNWAILGLGLSALSSSSPVEDDPVAETEEEAVELATQLTS